MRWNEGMNPHEKTMYDSIPSFPTFRASQLLLPYFCSKGDEFFSPARSGAPQLESLPMKVQMLSMRSRPNGD